jgi:hypothetical protein
MLSGVRTRIGWLKSVTQSQLKIMNLKQAPFNHMGCLLNRSLNILVVIQRGDGMAMSC